MGFIRGGLLVIASVLLFVILLAGSLMWTISLSLNYDNVKTGISEMVNSIAEDAGVKLEEELTNKLPFIEEYCTGNQEYVFDYEGYTLNIPCDAVSQGAEGVISSALNNLVEDFYYKEYDCGFWDCFGKEELPLFLVSAKARDYWQGKFYWTLTASLVLIGAMFLFVHKKTNLPILAGSLIIVSSLPLLKLGDILARFSSDSNVLRVLTLFLSESNSVFWTMIVIGAVLLVVGIFLKLFKVGFAISNFIGKFKKTAKQEKPKEEKPKEGEKLEKKPVKTSKK